MQRMSRRMAENSSIEWTDHTWSPWEGCTKVSPGCDHCYAERQNRWLRRGENWGPDAQRRSFSAAHWQKPLAWNARAARNGRRVRVFPSICDPFDNEVPGEWRHNFFALIDATPNLDWLLLTKRIGNAMTMLPWAPPGCDPPPNIWLGATVVNQEEADRDIPKLLATPARLRFLSIEPMLGDIRLGSFIQRSPSAMFAAGQVTSNTPAWTRIGSTAVDWVICGGESGPGARPANPDWFRSLRDQCANAGVPFFLKQWGEWIDADAPGVDMLGTEDSPIHRWGDLTYSVRIGKKAAGRLLDGVEHNGFPACPSN